MRGCARLLAPIPTRAGQVEIIDQSDAGVTLSSDDNPAGTIAHQYVLGIGDANDVSVQSAYLARHPVLLDDAASDVGDVDAGPRRPGWRVTANAIFTDSQVAKNHSVWSAAFPQRHASSIEACRSPQVRFDRNLITFNRQILLEERGAERGP